MARRIQLAICMSMTLLASVYMLDRAFPPDLSRYADTSQTVVATDGSVLRAFLSNDEKWRLPTAVKEIDPKYFRFLIAYEDKRFRSHMGVDPAALIRALAQWISSGEVVSGASTLTMQAARLLEPRPRTIWSKIIEMARAVQLEWYFSKSEILSIYATLAPFGGNIEGVRSASLAYFGKEPRLMTNGEAALLVALPQSPSRNRPDKFPLRASSARDKVLNRLVKSGSIGLKDSGEAQETNVSDVRHRFPFRAPHLARRLVSEITNSKLIKTYIVSAFQWSASVAIEHLVANLPMGANAAAIIAESSTGNVLAYVASGDFFDDMREGQVDFIRAVRSPGSALKPFIYAKAFEDGIAHPETLIDDRETHFGGYRPASFGGVSAGQMSARKALQLSLNVPAVLLLSKIGPRRFLSHFSEAGMHIHVPVEGQNPGLAIALGGLGISLEQLVTLYSSLARGGDLVELSFIKNRPSPITKPFVDSIAARAVSDILIDTPRPMGRYHSVDGRSIAFKTGTSSVSRDALAIGFDQNFTVGVWIGHPDAKPMHGATGMKWAAPVMFRIFDGLPHFKSQGRKRKTFIQAVTNIPKNLRTLSTREGLREFSIFFPVDGAEVSRWPNNDESRRGLPIKLRDGKRPFHIFINGKLLATRNLSRIQPWIPEGKGFYSVVAIDRDGKVARSNFRVLAN